MQIRLSQIFSWFRLKALELDVLEKAFVNGFSKHKGPVKSMIHYFTVRKPQPRELN